MKEFFKRLKNHFVPSEDNVYRPHILRKPWLIFFLTIVLTAEGVFIIDLLARQSALDFIAAVLPGEVIALTNSERQVYSLSQLTPNAELTSAAQAKANDMAAKGYFSHNGPDGKEPWAWIKESGYVYQYAGENLAVKFTGSQDVVNAWMASPSHKANIVKPAYTEIGVGVAEGMYQGEPATYVVQYFGTPRSNAPVASAPVGTSTVAAAPTQNVQGAETETPEGNTAAVTTSSGAPIQQAPSPWSSVAQKVLNQETKPSSTILMVMGAVAAVILVGLALAVFVHVQIQPTDMIVSGVVVAAIAIALLTFNTFVPGTVPTNEQSAAVFGAVPTSGGFITSSAASAEL